MQLNKPYLWLGLNAGTYTLEILANAAGSYTLTTSIVGSRIKLNYKDDGGGISFIRATPPPLYNLITPIINATHIAGYPIANYSKITVVIRNANNVIKGSCTVYSSIADTNPIPNANRPYAWLSPTKLYIKVNSGQVVVDNAPNDHLDNNKERTINCKSTGAVQEAEAALDNTTSFDPSNIDYIKAEVKTAAGTTLGVVTTGTTEGDASGGDELIDDLFD